MGGAYPDLAGNADSVLTIVSREEDRFRRTLRTGAAMLDEHIASLPDGGTVDGRVAFTLHDTHGFPFEVTEEIAAERGFEVDESGFQAAMADQRSRAKAAAKGGRVVLGDEVEAFRAIVEASGPTEFIGREVESGPTTVVGVVPGPTDGELAGTVSIFLAASPFYAESGGQVGDTGTIESPTARAEVLDTVYALPGLHRHIARVLDGTFDLGDEVVATIDGERRAAIKRHHTGTHILHWALREVLGDHVKQQGSIVLPDRLRFDFSHFEALTSAQIREIEDLANHEILGNADVRHTEMSMDEARTLGAIAFFGDKYGERVRVLEAGSRSIELCGGTHVGRLGDIGPIKIVSESSIGSNLRRIEAVAGLLPIERLRAREAELAAVAAAAGVPAGEAVVGVTRLRDQLRAAHDEIKALKKQLAGAASGDLASQAVDGIVVARVDGTERDDLRELAVSLRERPGIRAVVLASAPPGGGAALVAATTEESGLDASALVVDATKAIKGGGGRDARLVVAGGKDPGGLDEALALVRAAVGIA
jgi:alanyl-tRNA synthetase